MTNSRITYDNAWGNQDMITQILEMQRQVATGTYKSVSVTAGTGTDAGKYIFVFTDQEDTATTFKLAAKQISSVASSQTGSTVTLTLTFNDGTTQALTFSAGGDMTTDTAQTVTGTKTFTADQVFSGDVSLAGVDVSGTVVVQDTVQTEDLTVNGQAQLGENLAVEDSSTDSVLSCDGAIKLSDSYSTSGNRAYTSAGSSDILVKAHVADMPVVHLTSNESISGVKTFSSVITGRTAKSCRVAATTADGNEWIEVAQITSDYTHAVFEVHKAYGNIDTSARLILGVQGASATLKEFDKNDSWSTFEKFQTGFAKVARDSSNVWHLFISGKYTGQTTSFPSMYVSVEKEFNPFISSPELNTMTVTPGSSYVTEPTTAEYAVVVTSS